MPVNTTKLDKGGKRQNDQQRSRNRLAYTATPQWGAH